jgi:hypothetical protein
MLKRGCRGGTLPFPREEKVPFFIFGKYLRYIKNHYMFAS